MGQDFHNCSNCGEIFGDYGHFGHCGGCESILCGDCYDEAQEKHGMLGEDHPKASWYGEDAPNKCGCCDGTKQEMVEITKEEYEQLKGLLARINVLFENEIYPDDYPKDLLEEVKRAIK
jgi:hypothetical protein